MRSYSTLLITLSLNFVICRDFYVGMFKKNDILVAQDRLYKERIPYRIQYAKYGRHFKCAITYFRVVDRLGCGKGPKVVITRGGLRHKYLALRIQSMYNQPISVNIYVGCENRMRPTTTPRITKPATTHTATSGSGAVENSTSADGNKTVTSAGDVDSSNGTTEGGGVTEGGGDKPDGGTDKPDAGGGDQKTLVTVKSLLVKSVVINAPLEAATSRTTFVCEACTLAPANITCNGATLTEADVKAEVDEKEKIITFSTLNFADKMACVYMGNFTSPDTSEVVAVIENANVTVTAAPTEDNPHIVTYLCEPEYLNCKIKDVYANGVKKIAPDDYVVVEADKTVTFKNVANDFKGAYQAIFQGTRTGVTDPIPITKTLLKIGLPPAPAGR